MPTYDYECEACGHSFELFQSITAEPKKTCPACGRRRLKRLIGPGGALLFRGDGFYQTDYRSPEYERRAAQEKGGRDGNSSSQEKGGSPKEKGGGKKKKKGGASS